MRRLAKLDDPVDDLLALSFMNGDSECGLPLGSLENRQGKVATHIGFGVTILRGFQNFQHSVRMSGRLET